MKQLFRFRIICILIAALLASSALAGNLPEWAMGPFVRPAGVGPVIRPNPGSVFVCPMRNEAVNWQALHTFNPAATVMNGRIYILYRAEDDTGDGIGGHTSRIGIASSSDGIRFHKREIPVLFPADDSQQVYEKDGGCEDPRIVSTTNGTYVLTYTQWDRKTARLAVATSRDLFHWTKHGPVFAKALNGKYLNTWSKSGSIVTALKNGKLTAVKINGRYWMYWGEGSLGLAYSNNLKDWTMVEDKQGNPLKVMDKRPGSFDSDLVEAGPAAIVTSHGILVLYNGKNSSSGGDPTIDPGAYAAGQALFSLKDPTKLIDRLDTPYFRPEKDFEKTGQYPSGTTFTEGLTYFKGKWFLYYGCADSLVGVAIYQPIKQPNHK